MESGVSGLAEVLVKHAAQTIPAHYRSALRGCCGCLLPRRALTQALVGSGFLVVLDELLQHILEVAATKDQQMWTSSRLAVPPISRRKSLPEATDRAIE